VPLGRPIAEGGRSCLRSAAQASSVLLPNGMAWAGYPTTPTMPTTHVAIAHCDAAMPEVRLPFRAVWLMACYPQWSSPFSAPSRTKEGFEDHNYFSCLASCPQPGGLSTARAAWDPATRRGPGGLCAWQLWLILAFGLTKYKDSARAIASSTTSKAAINGRCLGTFPCSINEDRPSRAASTRPISLSPPSSCRVASMAFPSAKRRFPFANPLSRPGH
jgi:hypothetical protein